jgi:hypothetical protein
VALIQLQQELIARCFGPGKNLAFVEQLTLAK